MERFQEWLKDKKNMPIVAGAAVALIALAIVVILWTTGVIFQPAAPEVRPPVAEAPMGGPPVPGGYPGVAGPVYPGAPPGPGGPAYPGAPGMPGGPAGPGMTAATPGTTVKSAPVRIASAADPFLVSGTVKTTSGTGASGAIAPSKLVPSVYIAKYGQAGDSGAVDIGPAPNVQLTPDVAQDMVVSGVVLSSGKGPQAVLQTYSGDQQVSPGQDVPGRGKVMSIQSDGLMMRTDAGRTVKVPLGSLPTQGGGGYGGGYPGGGGYGGDPGYGGGYPGGGGYGGGGGYPGGGGYGGGGGYPGGYGGGGGGYPGGGYGGGGGNPANGYLPGD